MQKLDTFLPLMGILINEPSIYVYGSLTRYFVDMIFIGEGVNDIDIVVTDEGTLNTLISHSTSFEEIPMGRVTKYKLVLFDMNLDVIFTEDPSISAEDIIYSSTFKFQHCYFHMSSFYFNTTLYNDANSLFNDMVKKKAESFEGEVNFFNSPVGIANQIVKLTQRGWNIIDERNS